MIKQDRVSKDPMPWKACHDSKCLGCSHHPTAWLHAAATNLNCAAPTLESENESIFIGLYGSAVQTLGCMKTWGYYWRNTQKTIVMPEFQLNMLHERMKQFQNSWNTAFFIHFHRCPILKIRFWQCHHFIERPFQNKILASCKSCRSLNDRCSGMGYTKGSTWDCKWRDQSALAVLHSYSSGPSHWACQKHEELACAHHRAADLLRREVFRRVETPPTPTLDES